MAKPTVRFETGGLMAVARAHPLPKSLRHEAVAGIGGGVLFLADRQADDGSWANQPVVTALATTALLGAADTFDGAARWDLGKALDYISSHLRDDGALVSFESNEASTLATSLALQALSVARRPDDQAATSRALRFLLAGQNADGGFPPHPETTSCLIATVHAVEAIHIATLSGLATDDPQTGPRALAQAHRFIARCQPGNDNASDSGFFLATPPGRSDEEADDVIAPRALSTAMGLRGLVYADTPASSASVRAAMRWLENHAAFDHHPGAEQRDFYSYLLNLVKTLRTCDVAGVDFSRTPGLANWRHAATDEILTRQTGLGTWRSGAPEGMENLPDATTAYAILTLLNLVKWQP